MKTCSMCGDQKKDSEFREVMYGDLSDICKECEKFECGMDQEESEGYDDIIGYDCD